MKKRLSIMLTVVAVAAGLVGCSGPKSSGNKSGEASAPTEAPAADETPAEETEQIEFDGQVILGATAPLTGANQMVGEYYCNGMRIAVEEINAAGGVCGKELVLQIEDEGEDQSIALNATIKLIDQGVPAIIGSYFSTNCMAALPEVEKAGIPYFANGSNPDISAQENPYCWQIRVTDDFTGPIMAQVAVENMDMKNPAVLYCTAASTTIQAENFMQGMEDLGYPVDSNMVYGAPESETNFSAIINQIMASNVDGIVVMGVSEAWDLPLAQQLDAAGFDYPKLGSSSFSNAQFIEPAGDSGNGWVTVADYSSNVINASFEIPQETIDFETKYEELYGGMAAPQSAWGYDCVYLFKEACERAGTCDDRAAINEAMSETDLQGAGNYYTIYEDTFHVMSTYATLCENEDGAANPWDKVVFR